MITPPSIAVLPLGTGNDLARALNWGGVYTDESLSKILTKVLESRTVKLDRWKITTELNPDVDLNSLENSENAIDNLKNDVMNNYFSLGADAHICLEFHERRGFYYINILYSIFDILFLKIIQQKLILKSFQVDGSIFYIMLNQAVKI